MLGPDAAIALVRDQNPVRFAKVRYHQDRALNALHQGEKGSAPLPELAVLPRTPLPGGTTDEQAASRAEPAKGREPPPPFQVEPTLETSAEKLGIVREKQGDLKGAVAAHRIGSGNAAALR